MQTYEQPHDMAMEALGDGTRRAILDRLRREDRSVSDLAEGLPVSRPPVSQHLAVLRRAGLVRVRRQGTRRIYSLEPSGFEPVRRYVETMWDRALAGFSAAAEREENGMEQQTAIEPVRRSVTVAAAPERAFAVFTERFGEWWPLELHSIAVDDPEPGREGGSPVSAVIEPGEGGRVFERLADGTELGWGHVAAWEPPHRLVLSWNPSRTDRPHTEVEITFTVEGTGTRVDLEHRGWERLGPRGADVREGYASGWGGTLGRFASLIEPTRSTPERA
ncbi:MAG: metalloregulator ArsR/SmtB family transcription factor [Actinomycetota bacterium]